jgi:hypothetical protein
MTLLCKHCEARFRPELPPDFVLQLLGHLRPANGPPACEVTCPACRQAMRLTEDDFLPHRRAT